MDRGETCGSVSGLYSRGVSRLGCVLRHHPPRSRRGLASHLSRVLDLFKNALVLDAMGWVADRNNRPVPTRGTPHTERKLQVVLATRAFTLMPICECEPSGKLTATKQFALSQARRVPLRWPVLYLSILIVAQESGSTGCRQSFIPPLHEYRGFPERILHDSTFVLSYGICVFIAQSRIMQNNPPNRPNQQPGPPHTQYPPYP